MKLNPKKSELFSLHIIWCGSKISKDGVLFDPAYLKGLSEVARPETPTRTLETLSRASQFSKGLEALKDFFSTLSHLDGRP